MTTGMKAALTLTLEDKLSKGLNDIKNGFEDLRKDGSRLTLGKLERAENTLRSVGREMKNLTAELRGIETGADGAWSAMKRMASVKMQQLKGGAQQLMGPQGMAGRLGVIGGAVAGISLIKPVQDFANYQNIALHSAITKDLSGPDATTETNRLMKVFNKDALASGQSSTSIAHAYQDLIQQKMDPTDAEELLPSHSLAATAYNTTAESLGHTVFSLKENLKIDKEQMPGALASMALASKSGRFKIEDFNRDLPGITGNMEKLGMTGRGSADLVFAALETVARNSRDPAQAGTNFTDFMNAITAPHSARTFALDNRGMAPETREMLDKYHVTGINLPKLLETARENHVNPITAVLEALEEKTAGLPGDVRAQVLGAFLSNQESRDAATAMLLNAQSMKELVEHVKTADADMLHRDAQTAIASPTVQLNIGKEAAEQLERRAGEGFEPIVEKLTSGLRSMVSGVDALDEKYPKLIDSVLAVTGGMLALVIALAAIGVAAPAVGAGAALMGTAVTVGGGFALAAMPVAIPLAVPFIAKLGSDAETPENRAALDQLAKERRSMQGGPGGSTSDGFGPDGRPLSLDTSGTDHAQEPAKVDLTIHTDAGTAVTVNSADRDRVTVRHHPNPGPTTNRP